MEHIDEFRFHEYLDGALDEPAQAQIEGHLAVCDACRARLADLRLLFAALADVADVPLTADLSADVMAVIMNERRVEQPGLTQTPSLFPWFRFLLAAQGVAALAILLGLWPAMPALATQVADVTEAVWRTIEPSSLFVWDEVTAWLTAVIGQIEISGPMIDLATGQWLFLLGLAFIAWFAGNRLLLAPPARQRT